MRGQGLKGHWMGQEVYDRSRSQWRGQGVITERKSERVKEKQRKTEAEIRVLDIMK